MRIYAYVRDYGQFFSETARVHKRGRRWTTEDVRVILSIKALYHDRAGKENITKLLAQGWRMENSAIFGQEALSTLLEAAQLYEVNAAEVNKSARALTRETAGMFKAAQDDHKAVEAMRHEFHELYQAFCQLQAEVRTKRYSIFGPKDTGMHR